MTQNQYVKGQFHAYRALTKINFGKAGVDVYKDETIEFDGTTVRIGGQDYLDPAVRGAINAGWFVPESDNISSYIAKKADIRLRPAQNAGAKADVEMSVSEQHDEEREVSSLDATKAKRLASANQPQQRNAPSADADAQAQIAALLQQVQALQAQVALQNKATSQPTVTKTDDYSDVADYTDTSGQGAVPVSRIKTSAVQNFKADENTIRQAEQALQKDGTPLNVEHLKVNPVRTAKSVRLSADAATGDVQESREGYDLEDLLPDAIKGKPKGKVGVVNTEAEDKHPSTVVFVKASDGTQIPWDKSQHWKVRIKTAIAKYGNDHATLKAIIAVEDAGVRKELSKVVGD